MKPVFNAGPNTRYIGGVAIPAGEHRMVDERLLPRKAAARTEAAPEPAEDPDAVFAGEIRGWKVPEIKAAIEERNADGTANVSDRVLEMLSAAEQGAERPRASVLRAIDEEMLRRASERADPPEGTAQDAEAEAAGADAG